MSDRLRDLAVTKLEEWLTKGTRPQFNPSSGKVEELPISTKEIGEARQWYLILTAAGDETELSAKLEQAVRGLLDSGRKIPSPPKLEPIEAEYE